MRESTANSIIWKLLPISEVTPRTHPGTYRGRIVRHTIQRRYLCMDRPFPCAVSAVQAILLPRKPREGNTSNAGRLLISVTRHDATQLITFAPQQLARANSGHTAGDRSDRKWA